jgi:hypothetical protein
MRRKTPRREIYIRISLLFQGIHLSEDNDNLVRQMNRKRETFYFRLETWSFVKNEEIREKLLVFLRTCHFIDNIYLKYHGNQPFQSWRLNSQIHYRDIIIDSILFLDSRADVRHDYSTLPKDLKTEVRMGANGERELVIDILYRIKPTKVIIEKEDWSYIDDFSLFHERLIVKVRNLLIHGSNKVIIS